MAAHWLPDEFAALTVAWSAEELTAAARAQAGWMASQRYQDPRIADESEVIAPEDLKTALRVMRSLFDWNAHPDVSLSGAMLWAGLLLDLDAAAEARGEPSPLPLPNLWLSRGELDTIERWNQREDGETGDEADDEADTPGVCARDVSPGEERALPARRLRTLAAMPQPPAPATAGAGTRDGR